jgi:DNA adenine methylase
MIGPLAYIGGKNRLAKEIIALLPDHQTYVEAFAGGAQVFFHKEPSKVEVLNDLDFEIVNFFRVCQHHYQELVRYLNYCLISRRWYDLLAAEHPASLTDIQRAGRFFYLQKNSFGGLVVKQHYHYGVIQRPNYNPKRIPEIIEAAHQRLQGVQVESLPYEQILERYDRPTTLFYLDPPYWQRKLYKFNFSDDDFKTLERRLHDIRGKFILSLDDHPRVREIFQNWHILETRLGYTAQRLVGKQYGELLILNFTPAGEKRVPQQKIRPKALDRTPPPSAGSV